MGVIKSKEDAEVDRPVIAMHRVGFFEKYYFHEGDLKNLDVERVLTSISNMKSPSAEAKVGCG